MVLRLLQFLLLLAVLRAVWRLVKGMLEGAGYQQVAGGGAGVNTARKLVRDPNCGTFVSPERAAVTRVAGETIYFCSEKCRREWEKR